MTSARLLAVVLVLCPVFASAQDKQQPTTGTAPSSVTPVDSSSYRAMTEEQKAAFMTRALNRLMAGRHIDPNTQQRWITVFPDGKIVAWGIDSTCYSIRSYVVERDEKNSDSTHLVRSSTCVPATKYSVKTTELRGDSDHK
jgi:hypothetical protein